MTLTPLLAAATPIPLHAFAALAAFVLGLVQLAAPKGTLPHRTLGWIWAALMVTVAVSALWVHTRPQFGPFSWIHLMVIVVLTTLPLGLFYARRHRTAAHGWAMSMLFASALVIAGGFTLYPGRIMHTVVFGN